MTDLPGWAVLLGIVCSPLLAIGIAWGVLRSTVTGLKADVALLRDALKEVANKLDGHAALVERVAHLSGRVDEHGVEITRIRDKQHTTDNRLTAIAIRTDARFDDDSDSGKR